MEAYEYFPMLERISASLEKNIPEFPKNRCGEASKIIESVIGLKQVAGYYLGYKKPSDDPFDEFSNPCHMLNYDEKNNVYVDLTYHQFTGNDRIKIFPVEDKSFVRDSEVEKNLSSLYYDESLLEKIIRDLN